MKRILYLSVLCALISAGFTQSEAAASESWQAPFDTVGTVSRQNGSILTLGEVIKLVAADNPTLRALTLEQEASAGHLKQAGLWSNPELGAEIEEVGWDSPGLKESEITLSLSQEFELFGQRGARIQLARAEIDAIELQTRLSAYDLYLETKRRFYTLALAQKRLVLTLTSVDLARGIVENINFRIENGAALQSELLLAQLEEQRAQLMLEQVRQEVRVAQVGLAALWRGDPKETEVYADAEPELTNVMSKVSSLETWIDSTRGMLPLQRQVAVFRAEQSLAEVEARPTITFSGGYKHLEANKSNTLLFGVSLPLPLFNRNQGTLETLQARRRSLDYQIEQERLNATAAIKTKSIQLRQLVHRHDTLDSLLLPTAEQAHETLMQAYESGRIPYIQLLEAERSLNELRFEHNDMLLAIHEQIIALEGLTGVTLRIDVEKQTR